MHAPQLVHFLDFNHNHRVVCVTIVSIVLKFYATISHNSRQVRGATAADSEPAAQALATIARNLPPYLLSGSTWRRADQHAKRAKVNSDFIDLDHPELLEITGEPIKKTKSAKAE